MRLTNKQIAEAFSGGNFEYTFSYLADDIQWNIVGDKIVKGRGSVIEFCNKTAKYFADVTTKFTISNMIVDANLVSIDGTAQFINKENKSTYVSSCDVYNFNDGKLQEITSYCIVTRKG